MRPRPDPLLRAAFLTLGIAIVVGGVLLLGRGAVGSSHLLYGLGGALVAALLALARGRGRGRRPRR